MVYITQLIHIASGKEGVFNEFEESMFALIGRHHGTVLLRLRPDRTSIVYSSIEFPYEVHIVKFLSEQAFENFMNDEDRRELLHRREQSIRSVIVIKGQIVAPMAARLSIL